MNWKVKNVIARFLIALAVLLHPTSSSGQTNAISVTLETSLTKNEKAPFEGVLVPYPQYYYYNEAVEKSFENEVGQLDCGSCLTPTVTTGTMAFVVGLIAGISLTLSR